MANLNVLAMSGSLRSGSHNTALLHAARALSPADMTIEIYPDLGRLPLYDQDLDTIAPPPSVTSLRERVAAASALLIATPEHNASIPAALKNAIDWVSKTAHGLLADKPVAVAGASPGQLGSMRAQLALRQVLMAVGADVVVKPEVIVFRCETRFTANGVLTDPDTAERLRDLLEALTRKARASLLITGG